jgi:hypothetical protein
MDRFKLPAFNYFLDVSDPDVFILRRQDGAFVAAFSPNGATEERVRQAATEDYRALVEESMGSLDLWPSKEQQGT